MDTKKRKSTFSSDGAQPCKKRVNDDVKLLLLGYDKSEVNIAMYAESHAMEIQSLQKAVQVQQGGHAMTQKLPPHMRRRALSHNIKRMPRVLRAAAAHLFENQKGQVRKRPSRFYRRKPKNLLQEYQRRQRKHIWLETHIWHAKRFHMVEKWGHKIPWRPTQKSERAAYRASSKHCLLQDVSYMCCIELSGSQNSLLEGFAHVSNKVTGQTFAAVSCLSGTREGHTMMYRYDQYPFGAIGPVSFMWRPVTEEAKGSRLDFTRNIWVWCHPACFQDVWDSFLKCFLLTKSRSCNQTASDSKEHATSESTTVCQNKDKDKAVECDKAEDPVESKGVEVLEENGKNREDKPIIHDKFKTDIQAINEDTGVQMSSLSGSVLRFRLTGPQSNAVLFDALQQADIVPSGEPVQPEPWWDSYYTNSHRSLGHDVQRETIEVVKECQSPAELPPRAVLGLLVRDPRLHRPTTRTKVQADETGITQSQTTFKQKMTPNMSASALWDSDVRKQVVETKLSDFKIHQLRSECLVPGLQLELGNSESRVPVVLIQRPGAQNTNSPGLNPCTALGRGSGWDLLLPKSWGMAFWLALVFRGARCGGLREMQNCCHEEKSLLFPNDYPDTLAGFRHQSKQEKELVDKYNRRPPAKRTNYTKYGVAAPFTCPWINLLQVQSKCELSGEIIGKGEKGEGGGRAVNVVGTDNTSTENQLIAEKETVDGAAEVNVVPDNQGSIPDIGFYVLRDIKLLRRLGNVLCASKSAQPKDKLFDEILNSLTNLKNGALIPVRIEILQRGVPNTFSSICLPSPSDMAELLKDKKYAGPKEARHVDPVELLKQGLKKEMKAKMRKKKVKVDRTLKVLSEREQMNVDNCSRKTIGYLVSGGYSLGIGGGSGVGYVSSEGMYQLLQGLQGTRDPRALVLVRGQSTLLYRFAILSVLM